MAELSTDFPALDPLGDEQKKGKGAQRAVCPQPAVDLAITAVHKIAH